MPAEIGFNKEFFGVKFNHSGLKYEVGVCISQRGILILLYCMERSLNERSPTRLGLTTLAWIWMRSLLKLKLIVFLERETNRYLVFVQMQKGKEEGSLTAHKCKCATCHAFLNFQSLLRRMNPTWAWNTEYMAWRWRWRILSNSNKTTTTYL